MRRRINWREADLPLSVVKLIDCKVKEQPALRHSFKSEHPPFRASGSQVILYECLDDLDQRLMRREA